MAETIKFLWLAYRAYTIAKKTGTAYSGIVVHGVPRLACFVGVGRESWRISQRAIEEFQLKN